MHLYDGITLRIKPCGIERRPITRVSRPTRWIKFASLQIQCVTSRQNFLILTSVTVSGANLTNAAMTVVMVGQCTKSTAQLRAARDRRTPLGETLADTWQHLPEIQLSRDWT